MCLSWFMCPSLCSHCGWKSKFLNDSAVEWELDLILDFRRSNEAHGRILQPTLSPQHKQVSNKKSKVNTKSTKKLWFRNLKTFQLAPGEIAETMDWSLLTHGAMEIRVWDAYSTSIEAELSTEGHAIHINQHIGNLQNKQSQSTSPAMLWFLKWAWSPCKTPPSSFLFPLLPFVMLKKKSHFFYALPLVFRFCSLLAAAYHINSSVLMCDITQVTEPLVDY